MGARHSCLGAPGGRLCAPLMGNCPRCSVSRVCHNAGKGSSPHKDSQVAVLNFEGEREARLFSKLLLFYPIMFLFLDQTRGEGLERGMNGGGEREFCCYLAHILLRFKEIHKFMTRSSSTGSTSVVSRGGASG